MDLATIRRLSTDGNHREAYLQAMNLLNEHPDLKEARSSAGWSLRALLEEAAHTTNPKMFEAVLRRFAELRLHEIGMAGLNNRAAWHMSKLFSKLKAANATDYMLASRLFAIIRTMTFDPADKYYAYFIDAFLKLSSDKGPWPQFAEFCEWWNLRNLTPGNYQSRITNSGQEMPSIAERALTACAKVLLWQLHTNQNSDYAPRFVEFMIEKSREFPEFSFLPYQIAQLQLALGKPTEARLTILPFVRKMPTTFWAWELLGDASTSVRDRVACYARALSCKAEPQFTERLRRKFAQILAENHLDESCRQDAIKYSDTIIQKDLDEIPLFVTSSNTEKCVFSFVTPDLKRGFCGYRKVLPEAPRPFTVLLSRIEQRAGNSDSWKLVSARRDFDLAKYSDIFFRKIEGQLKAGRASFVGDVYVPDALARGIPDRAEVEGVAVISFNLKTQKWGWKAVKLQPAAPKA